MEFFEITAVQDGNKIKPEFIKKYRLSGRDVKVKIADGKEIYLSNFVGIVRRGANILVSLPKHYIELSEFNLLPNDQKISHIKFIMSIVLKFEINDEYKEFRKENEMNSDFSMSAFFEVYDYYKKFGLFQSPDYQINKGFSGKITWKDTMRKSNKIFSKDNIIFSPFYVKKKIPQDNLITSVMIFIINYTEYIFRDLLSLPDNSKIVNRGIEKRFMNNPSLVEALYKIRSKTFKDIDCKLLDNIILFFNGVNKGSADTTAIKHYNFSAIWESAVQKYLNNFFFGVEDKCLIFKNFRKENVSFKKETFIGFDNQRPSLRIEPDHYYLDKGNDTQYIFDSKYYNRLDQINYKQLVYQLLLSNKATVTYNALIMPYEGPTRSDVHVNIDPSWLPNGISIYIILEKLNMVDVLTSFLNDL